MGCTVPHMDESRERRSDRRGSSRRRRARRLRAERRLQQREAAVQAKLDRAAARAEAKAARLAAREPAVVDVEQDLAAAAPHPDLHEPAEPERGRSRPLARAGHGLLTLALLASAAGLGVGLRYATRGAGTVAASLGDGEVLPPGVDRQPALLVVTADDGDPAGAARNAMILAYDRIKQSATILLIPVSTVADIPGHGVLPFSRSLEFGGAALAAATADNLLGVSLDGVAAMTTRGWATLLGRAGSLQVEVPERIAEAAPDGGVQVQFLAGTQQFDGPRAADYLTASIEGEPELSALPRIQAVLVAWLSLLGSDQNLLQAALEDGLPMLDTGMPRDEVLALVTLMAEAARDDRLEVRVVPVRPIGSGAQDGYRADETRLDELIAELFDGSVPHADRAGRSLQVLNGNGSPGIGQSVAARLLPAGFRVILTGNADNFDHAETKVVIYDDSPEQLAIAAEIVELLGVGTVELSLTPQSVVDVTIVVGQDFTAS